MKKLIILCIVILTFAGCSAKVTYLYKNENLVPKIYQIPYSSFGIVVMGDEINHLYNVIEGNLQKYYSYKVKVSPISEKFISIENDKVNLLDLKENISSDIDFLLIVRQHKPSIKRRHNKNTETEEYYEWGILKTKEVDYEYYTTIVSVKCETFLYDIDEMHPVAKAVKTFSSKKTRKERDMFSNKTLFGGLENFFDFLESDLFGDREPTTDLDKYPNIADIHPIEVGDYFYKYIEELKKNTNSNQ